MLDVPDLNMSGSSRPAWLSSNDEGAGGALVHGGLPLPDVARRARRASTCWVISSIDSSGRLANRGMVRAIGWTVGCRVQIEWQGRRVAVKRHHSGDSTIGNRGHLRIPASVRRRLQIQKQDRLIAYVDTAQGEMVLSIINLLPGCHLTGGQADEAAQS